MNNTRCEEVIVQIIIRTYDDTNRPVGEQTSQQVKVFRNAQTRDFWGEVDKAVAALQKQQTQPSADVSTPKPKAKR